MLLIICVFTKFEERTVFTGAKQSIYMYMKRYKVLNYKHKIDTTVG